MKELWKDVVGYEDIYEVNNYGQVRTKTGKTTFSTRWNAPRHWKQRTLKEKNVNGREVRVDLWKQGKPKTFLVHRIVAEAFIPKVEGKECINHKDGNPRNNKVHNLEWCTHEENINHAYDTGLITVNKPITLIDKETKKELNFRSRQKASEFIGMSHGYISKMLKKNKLDLEKYTIKTDSNGEKK